MGRGWRGCSGWTKDRVGDHVVLLYRAGTWDLVRRMGAGRDCGPLDGQLSRPYGLAFSEDGAALAVADALNNRVCLFDVGRYGGGRDLLRRHPCACVPHATPLPSHSLAHMAIASALPSCGASSV